MRNWEDEYKKILKEQEDSATTANDVEDMDDVLYFVLELVTKAIEGEEDATEALDFLRNIIDRKVSILDKASFIRGQKVDKRDEGERMTGLTSYFRDLNRDIKAIKKENE